MPASPSTAPATTPSCAPCAAPPARLSPPTDLTARREAAESAVRAAASAPVRHLPAALLDALQGSWGSPDEILGVRAPVVALASAL